MVDMRMTDYDAEERSVKAGAISKELVKIANQMIPVAVVARVFATSVDEYRC